MFEGVTVPDLSWSSGGGSVTTGLLDQHGQKLGLELQDVEAVLDGVLGQHHVVVDTRGVQDN